jgi:hypothetical protein
VSDETSTASPPGTAITFEQYIQLQQLELEKKQLALEEQRLALDSQRFVFEQVLCAAQHDASVQELYDAAFPAAPPEATDLPGGSAAS